MQIAAQAITGAIAPRSWNQPWSKASADPKTSSVEADAVVADAAPRPPLAPPPASTEYSDPGVTVVYVGGTVVVVDAVLGGSVLGGPVLPPAATDMLVAASVVVAA